MLNSEVGLQEWQQWQLVCMVAVQQWKRCYVSICLLWGIITDTVQLQQKCFSQTHSLLVGNGKTCHTPRLGKGWEAGLGGAGEPTCVNAVKYFLHSPVCWQQTRCSSSPHILSAHSVSISSTLNCKLFRTACPRLHVSFCLPAFLCTYTVCVFDSARLFGLSVRSEACCFPLSGSILFWNFSIWVSLGNRSVCTDSFFSFFQKS